MDKPTELEHRQPETTHTLIAQGVYADIVLLHRGRATLASTPLSVIKVVSAPLDGRDASRLPHNIVLEAKILAECHHPNIIQLSSYDFDSESQIHSLALPYLPLTLLSILNDPTFTDHTDHSELFRSIAWQCLNGLSYLHKKEIAHRDINPCNILLDEDGTVTLIDLSTAHAPHIWSNGYEEDSMICQVGTGPYRAPELLFGSTSYDPQAIDLWAMGTVLAEFFTGERCDPFEDSRSTTGLMGKPLFDATFGDIGLGASIFRIRGSPKYTWPGFADLPDASKVAFDDQPPTHLTNHLPRLQGAPNIDNVLSLLEGLLALPPGERLSCERCLRLPLFAPPMLLPPGYPSLGDGFMTHIGESTLS